MTALRRMGKETCMISSQARKRRRRRGGGGRGGGTGTKWTAALLSCCSVLQAFSKTTSRVSCPLNDDDNVQKKTLFRRKTQKTLGVTSSLNSTFTFWPKCRFYLHCYAPFCCSETIFFLWETHIDAHVNTQKHHQRWHADKYVQQLKRS